MADTDAKPYYLDSVSQPFVGCRQCARLWEELCELRAELARLQSEQKERSSTDADHDDIP
jgi:hypothetical protein